MSKMLDYFATQYYAGTPVISDEEFDRLADYYGYENVGAAVQGNTVAHPFPMWSLQKCYTDEPRIALSGDVIESPKLDGAAISVTYVYGKLSLALTRGDGKQGLPITDKIREIVPNTIASNEPLVQITGEIVAPKTLDNARNYAAGALNLKSVDEFKTRQLTFVAYGYQPHTFDNFSDQLRWVSSQGFNTILDGSALSIFPTDGLVYRTDNYLLFYEAGYTAKHPRGAFALKERTGGVITKLLGVDWQVGRSGVVSPVALLEPVVIGEATVSRATLHNMKYIQDLDLEIGCLVEVVRAGEIIPRVLRRIYE